MELMAVNGESWDTARRRNRYRSGKVSGVGAREANSTPGSTPGPSKGSAGRGGRRPVVSSPQMDRTQLVYQSVAIELNGQNVTQREVINDFHVDAPGLRVAGDVRQEGGYGGDWRGQHHYHRLLLVLPLGIFCSKTVVVHLHPWRKAKEGRFWTKLLRLPLAPLWVIWVGQRAGLLVTSTG